MLNLLTRALPLLSLFLANPVLAQTVNTQESASPYATDVRGWAIYVMGDGRGINSCRAVRGQGYGDQIMLEYDGFDQAWQIMVQARRPAGGGLGILGAAAIFDGQVIDAQVGFGLPEEDGASDSHAVMDLTDDMLGRLKSGSVFELNINGEQNRQFSLTGTAAAALKIEECAASWGFPVAGSVVQPVPQTALDTPSIDGFNIGYVRFPRGQFRQTGGLNWVEEGDDGAVFYFTEVERVAEAVLLNDASRDVQVVIDLEGYQLLWTEGFNDNGWAPIGPIDCFGLEVDRSC